MHTHTLPTLESARRVRHGFFGRGGGVSEGLYSSLNCGNGSKDDPACVAENRRRAAAHMGVGETGLVTAYQVHSDRIATVDTPWPPGEAPKVDGLVTREPGIALAVLTADCAPVLLADDKAGVIGAAHAGWRGALDGILAAVVDAMVALGARRADIAGGVGPAIGKDSYEVGPEFPDPFLTQAPDNDTFFRPAPRAGHFLFDLTGYVARRLTEAGVGGVEVLPFDTCADEDGFFSYRRACQRGEGDYGRALSAIALQA